MPFKYLWTYEMKFLKFLILVVIALSATVEGLETSLTINVPAGVNECLHQYLEKGVHYEVEYQVIDGGDLDINFLISTPSQYQQPFITDFRRTGNVHKNVASETGDYRFCIDNSFSHFTHKIVFFELYTNDDKDDDDDEIDKMFGSTQDVEEYEVKLEDFKGSLDRIKEHLLKSTQTQRVFSVIESRDRSVLEHNFERVNFMSAVQLTVMIVAGFVNIVMIRRLFNSPKAATRQRT